MKVLEERRSFQARSLMTRADLQLSSESKQWRGVLIERASRTSENYIVKKEDVE
jgi:hypothetical protein